jgi:DNA-binding Lrp family transcriptional regulator
MEKLDVILGYRANIDYSKLGYVWYKLWIRAKKRPNDLVGYIDNHLNVIYRVEELGLTEELDIELVVKNAEELFYFVEEIKEKFPTIVSTYRTFMYDRVRKVRYVPFLYNNI